MSELISGKEALSQVYSGRVQYMHSSETQDRWTTITDHYYTQYHLGMFLDEDSEFKFRLKPRTITINDKELPKPLFTCHSTSNSNIIEIGFNTEQEARDFHLQFRRAWK